MKRNRIYRIMTLFVIGVFALAGCNRYQGMRHSPETSATKMVEHVSDELDLTGPQREQLESALRTFIAGKDGLHDTSSIRNQILSQLKADAIDKAGLNEVIEKEIEEFKVLTQDLVSDLAEFHRSLSPEQRAKLAALIEEHKGKGRFHGRKYSRR